MNFDFTDDQNAIKRTARDLLADRFKPDTVRELAEAERYDEAHWREIAELGWAGIFVDEQHGGQGLGPNAEWTYRFLRSRANSIEGGTTDVLKNIVAERVLGLPRLR